MKRVISLINKFSRPVVSLLISVWALYLRFDCLAKRDLWGDEIYQISRTVGPLKPFWQRISYGDFTCFPGDYLLTYPFINFFGSNKWGLAIPHIIVTALGFFLLYLLCKRHFKTIVGYMVTFGIVCFNQHLIFHSFELRPYAVLPTLAIASCYLSDVLVCENVKMDFWKKFFIGLFFVATIWFHAFGIMIVFLPLAFFLFSRRKEESFGIIFRDVFKFSLTVLTISLPLWLWYVSGSASGTGKWDYSNTQTYPFTYVLNPLFGFWKFFDRVVLYNLIGYTPFYFLLGGLIFFIIIPFKEKLKKFAFFLILILLPIELILEASLISGYWFLIRQYIFVAPLFAFFLGWLWDSSIYYYLDVENRKFTPRSILGLILLVGCTIAGIVSILA